MKIIVVGEALSKQGDGRPLTGPSGERLARLCDVSTSRLRHHFVLLNLCSGYEWHREDAEAGVIALRRRIEPGDRVILLGRKVERVLSSRRQALYRPWPLWGARFYTAPHPSGLNHYWNDRRNVEDATSFWREVITWSSSPFSPTAR